MAFVLGGLTIYCFWLILTVGAFWIIRIDQIVELFEGVYQSGRWPVTIYPGWLRISLTFLVPVAFAVTVPAQALTNRLRPCAKPTAANPERPSGLDDRVVVWGPDGVGGTL